MTDPGVVGVGETALMTAAARALERGRPGGVLDDPWAEALAGTRGFEVLRFTDPWLFEGGAVTTSHYVLRHRIYDEFLLRWTGEGFRQVVLIAAGLDTRAFRLPWPSGVRVYELDFPAILRHKALVLERAGAVTTCSRTPIEVDLRDPWVQVLVDAGFEPKSRSAWVAEGLLFYLEAAEAGRLLIDMSGVAAPGSRLLAQTMSTAGDADFDARFDALGAPFTFRTDDGPGFLRAHGWEAEEVAFDGLSFGTWQIRAASGSTLVGTKPTA